MQWSGCVTGRVIQPLLQSGLSVAKHSISPDATLEEAPPLCAQPKGLTGASGSPQGSMQSGEHWLVRRLQSVWQWRRAEGTESVFPCAGCAGDAVGMSLGSPRQREASSWGLRHAYTPRGRPGGF
ncbi:hypothetical protein AAFF_G00282250 [Aldrovandia affinis]|uniref:Uncharacterized protein n=1 Tax=Aldrovandia affinis TaxID=143900 RepID=A0AAD7X1S5_9TELE|nr:hypothetical protein AAFF_G00282250 [Aldrovandia affinis]